MKLLKDAPPTSNSSGPVSAGSQQAARQQSGHGPNAPSTAASSVDNNNVFGKLRNLWPANEPAGSNSAVQLKAVQGWFATLRDFAASRTGGPHASHCWLIVGACLGIELLLRSCHVQRIDLHMMLTSACRSTTGPDRVRQPISCQSGSLC